MEEPVDAEYHTYRILAFEKAAVEAYSKCILAPYHDTAGMLLSAAKCFLAVDTVYAYMLRGPSDFDLFERLESMDRESPEFHEIKTYVSRLIPLLSEVKNLGDGVRRFCESSLLFRKEAGKTRRVFIQIKEDIHKFKLAGERIVPDGTVSDYPALPGDVLVTVTKNLPFEETILPVVSLNMWRFIE